MGASIWAPEECMQPVKRCDSKRRPQHLTMMVVVRRDLPTTSMHIQCQMEKIVVCCRE
jgi:hypothetical protein